MKRFVETSPKFIKGKKEIRQKKEDGEEEGEEDGEEEGEEVEERR